jgi:hypothetical protein
MNVAKRNSKAELIRLAQEYPKDTQTAITKSGKTNMTYEAWMSEEKNTAFASKETVAKKFATINSILPTLHANDLL